MVTERAEVAEAGSEAAEAGEDLGDAGWGGRDLDSVGALDHLAEDSGHLVILHSITHRIGYNTSLFSQDPFLRSQGGVGLDPGAHPLAGILVGDLPWEDLEDPGDQDPDQWVQGDLEGQGIGVRLTGDLEVQGVQEVQGAPVEQVD